MPRRENLIEDQISKELMVLDEKWEEDTSDSYSIVLKMVKVPDGKRVDNMMRRVLVYVIHFQNRPYRCSESGSLVNARSIGSDFGFNTRRLVRHGHQRKLEI
ncbi:Hypothetical predicted protein [Octopus vulgaris]|uniref:Uncharacterized protein n=1 Tax=Octopus vulgaris TaxID=6645 RepID=A0AA36BSH9_OCTVU|nr:Hypothetical predicted protein [Octopus vulgaris]